MLDLLVKTALHVKIFSGVTYADVKQVLQEETAIYNLSIHLELWTFCNLELQTFTVSSEGFNFINFAFENVIDACSGLFLKK